MIYFENYIMRDGILQVETEYYRELFARRKKCPRTAILSRAGGGFLFLLDRNDELIVLGVEKDGA